MDGQDNRRIIHALSAGSRLGRRGFERGTGSFAALVPFPTGPTRCKLGRMDTPPGAFQKPTAIERLFNAAIGALVGWGIGLPDMRVLEVRGRKSGKLYALPVDLLSRDGRLYLVAPRGRAEWVRNAEAAGSVVLRRGRRSESYRLRALADAEKPPIVKAYLDRFHREVQRFFPVPAGSPVEAFAEVASRYPAFELVRT
jgi:deazaflavin-dependent oxidoreductase (nitroreductase family)